MLLKTENKGRTHISSSCSATEAKLRRSKSEHQLGISDILSDVTRSLAPQYLENEEC